MGRNSVKPCMIPRRIAFRKCHAVIVALNALTFKTKISPLFLLHSFRKEPAVVSDLYNKNVIVSPAPEGLSDESVSRTQGIGQSRGV